MTFSFRERSMCPACGSSDRTTLVRTPLDGPVIGPIVGRYYGINPKTLANGLFFVVECTRCVTIYHAQVACDDLLTTLYDVWLNDVHDSDDQARLDWLAAHPRQSRDGHELMTVAAMIGAYVQGLKTLDFGMGKGLWAGIAKKLGCQSYGFDLSETRMREAQDKGIQTIALGDIAGGDFDFINTEQVMEHIGDTRSIMEVLTAGLRKGGIIKISVPAQGNARDSLARIRAGEAVTSSDIIPILPLEHVNAFSSRGIETLGANVGLTKVRPSLLHRLRFLSSPANWISAKPANTIKELVRPFIPYENKRNQTTWLTTAADR